MDTKSIVYSRNVIEFATVAKEFCAFLESADRHSRRSFVTALGKLLPLLYYKASVLPDTEPVYEDENEKFVTEEVYSAMQRKLKQKFGQHDDFLEVYDPRANESDGQYAASLAEYLADIYQDLKNFTELYHVGNMEVMNDALWECRANFIDYWGIRLANAIRALHILLYSGIDLDREEVPSGSEPEKEHDTSSWFITRRQNDMEHEGV